MYDNIIGWLLLIGLISIAVIFMYLSIKTAREIKTAFREYRTFETYRIHGGKHTDN